ncbi:MAG: hypothetical protein A2Z82_00050 [Nitrospirae bacterium GWA2_46_11]|nr:MAG: hypothetical protein A2Z82_00050 [Nitrospirae bacterium GWA2_46_11]
MKQEIKKLFAHHALCITHRGSGGFTLIELAMVLVVIGIVLSIGVGLIGPLTKRVRYGESKDIVSAAVESVNSYASGNNKIPDSTGFSTTVRNPNDAFGKALIYIYDGNLAPASATKDTICGRKTASITVQVCPDATCATPTSTISNVAFVIISGSDDYTIDSKCPTSACSTGAYSGNAKIFDEDIVKWVTLDELRTKVGCKGAQLNIVNNELPYGTEGASYNATVSADGGVTFSDGADSDTDPDYKWCISGTLPNGITNPASGCTVPTSCATLSDDTGWLQSTYLSITGTPSTSPQSRGVYNIKIFVHDNNSVSLSNVNCDQKPFILTINPQN